MQIHQKESFTNVGMYIWSGKETLGNQKACKEEASLTYVT